MIKIITAKLMDRVQFIYELALAQLELKGLNAKFEIENGLRTFIIKEGDIELLTRRVAYFKMIDNKPTVYEQLIKFNQTKSINQYLTHWIYPYKGKFHPQMIRALINSIKLNEGDLLLDPFIGSGTTALEAQLMGINVIGVDISPLCVLQSKVKTESVFVLNKIKKIKDEAIGTIQNNNGLKNFDLSKNTSFKEFMNQIKDERVRNFYIIAEMIAHSDKTRRNKNFVISFITNLQKMIKSVEDFKEAINKLKLNLGNVQILRGDARELNMKDETIDGIITSPPYSIALDYVKNDAHALKALGYDTTKLREKVIGVRGKGIQRIELYNNDIKKSINEMYRVLKPGKYCVIIIGNATYQGKKIDTVNLIIDHAKSIGFKLIKNIDKIIFGLYNVMQKENILIFQKPY